MIKLKYGGKYFDILDSISMTKASNEVTFDDVSIDFTGYSIDDLPTKYQEVQIVDIETIKDKKNVDVYENHPALGDYPTETTFINNKTIKQIDIEYQIDNILYTGYVEDYSLNDRKNNWEDVELSLTLLTPMKMATLRYVNISGQYTIDKLIPKILEPLTDDGFILKVNEVPTASYKVNWVLKSVENAMNIISNIFSLWWYIDENKNIYIYDINKLLNSSPKMKITNDQLIEGLFEVSPELNVEEYANQVSIKNARVIRRAEGCGVGDNAYPRIFFDRLNKIYKDETYTFDNPIVFYTPEQYSKNQILFRLFLNKYAIFVTGMLPDGTIKGYYYTNPIYGTDSSGNVIITSYTKKVENKGMVVQADGTSLEDEDNYIIIFKKDGFFNNLITGFEFKGVDSNISYPKISPYSDTSLVYEVYKVKDKAEISRKKGIISSTGIVEKVIDANEKWFKENELHLYAINQLDMLKTDGTKVTLKTDVKSDINVGDLINIDWEEFYIKDKYICSSITETITKTGIIEEREWEITLINAEMNTTFIDLFRPEDTEEDETGIVYFVDAIYGSENVDEIVDIKSDEVM